MNLIYKFFDNLLYDSYDDYYDDYYDYSLPTNSGVKYVKIQDQLYIKKLGTYLKILDCNFYHKKFCLRKSCEEEQEDLVFKIRHNLYTRQGFSYTLFPYDTYIVISLEQIKCN